MQTTSKLNIGLHIPPIVGFSYFVFISGDTFFSGVMATIALFFIVDMVACIKARIGSKHDKSY